MRELALLDTRNIDAMHHPTSEEIVRLSEIGVCYMVGRHRDTMKSRMLDKLRHKNLQEQMWVLRNFSLKCFKGEIIGIIGSNGAGKTTLCRVLSGLLKPDEGHLKISGMVCALFSLGTGFRLDLSGRENIFLNGMMLGFSKHRVRRISQEVIEFSELEDFIDQPLKYYSSGMKARLGFSIATMMEPEILVLDEALSTGDLKFSGKAGIRLQQLIQKSKLVLVVSHNISFVQQYCSRVIWIDKGTIRGDGMPEEITEQYISSGNFHPKKKSIVNLNKTISSGGTREIVQADRIGVKFLLQKRGAQRFHGKSRIPEIRSPLGRTLWALKDINFKVMEGDVLGIIGPNGAGKTTLCRVLCGILKPDTGKVRIRGSITALLTFGAGFNIELAAKDNIYTNGLMLGLAKKEIDRLFPDIIDFSEISEKYIHQPIKYYSSGMKARLGFSIVSTIKPDVFIIDEALNAGDASFYEKASAKIQELIKEAKATIIVTHNINFIEHVCTRAMLLDKGEIRFDGNPEEAVAAYRRLNKRR